LWPYKELSHRYPSFPSIAQQSPASTQRSPPPAPNSQLTIDGLRRIASNTGRPCSTSAPVRVDHPESFAPLELSTLKRPHSPYPSPSGPWYPYAPKALHASPFHGGVTCDLPLLPSGISDPSSTLTSCLFVTTLSLWAPTTRASPTYLKPQ